MQKTKAKIIKRTFLENKKNRIEKKSKEKKANFIGAVIANDPNSYPKTGEWKFFSPQVIINQCIGCGICEKFCPEGVIHLRKKFGSVETKAQIELEFCKGCGICAQVCPKKAIKMKN